MMKLLYKWVLVLLVTLLILFAVALKLRMDEVAYRDSQRIHATYEAIATEYSNK